MVRMLAGWSIKNILEFIFPTLHREIATVKYSHSGKSWSKGHNPHVSSATGLDFQTSNWVVVFISPHFKYLKLEISPTLLTWAPVTGKREALVG